MQKVMDLTPRPANRKHQASAPELKDNYCHFTFRYIILYYFMFSILYINLMGKTMLLSLALFSDINELFGCRVPKRLSWKQVSGKESFMQCKQAHRLDWSRLTFGLEQGYWKRWTLQKSSATAITFRLWDLTRAFMSVPSDPSGQTPRRE